MTVLNITDKASLACQVRMNIRCKKELSYIELTKIFKNDIEFDLPKYQNYLYGFFEECYPSLIKKFMQEQSISRKQILDIFQQLPDRGEKRIFQEVLDNGQF